MKASILFGRFGVRLSIVLPALAPQIGALWLFTAVPAQAQTTLLSATLNVKEIGGGSNGHGCWNATLVLSVRCSTTATLSDDDFAYDGTDYAITGIFSEPGAVVIQFDKAVPQGLRTATLNIGSLALSLSNPTTVSGGGTVVSWGGGSYPQLTLGSAVSVSLVSPSTDAGGPTSGGGGDGDDDPPPPGDDDGDDAPGDDPGDDDDDGPPPTNCTLAAPFWSGPSGGFVVRPLAGRRSVRVTCGATTTEYTAEGGLVTRLVRGSCPGGLTITGAEKGGGWYWQHGERNAAAAPLVCSEDLDGPRAVVPGGVEAEATDTGTWFKHDTARLVGIVPHLAGNECSEYVTPYWQGNGGVVVRPAAGRERVSVRVQCGRMWSTMRPTPGADGVVVALVRADFCTDDEGNPKQGSLTVTDAAPGGWYWVSGERNAAVAPLMCADLLGGPAAVDPGGVSSRATEDGTYFSHDTNRLIGVVPHIVPDREGN